MDIALFRALPNPSSPFQEIPTPAYDDPTPQYTQTSNVWVDSSTGAIVCSLPIPSSKLAFCGAQSDLVDGGVPLATNVSFESFSRMNISEDYFRNYLFNSSIPRCQRARSDAQNPWSCLLTPNLLDKWVLLIKLMCKISRENFV